MRKDTEARANAFGKLLKGQYGARVKCTLLLDATTAPILELGKVSIAQGQGAHRETEFDPRLPNSRHHVFIPWSTIPHLAIQWPLHPFQ